MITMDKIEFLWLSYKRPFTINIGEIIEAEAIDKQIIVTFKIDENRIVKHDGQVYVEVKDDDGRTLIESWCIIPEDKKIGKIGLRYAN